VLSTVPSLPLDPNILLGLLLSTSFSLEFSLGLLHTSTDSGPLTILYTGVVLRFLERRQDIKIFGIEC
jgi:hypothetical protein